MDTSEETTQHGFTLIELLVVILIIGVLAGIAIPIFLVQRAKAYDASIETDLRNVGVAEESAYLTSGGYTTSVAVLAENGFEYSAASNYHNATASITISLVGNGYMCAQARSASGTTFSYDTVRGLGEQEC